MNLGRNLENQIVFVVSHSIKHQGLPYHISRLSFDILNQNVLCLGPCLLYVFTVTLGFIRHLKNRKAMSIIISSHSYQPHCNCSHIGDAHKEYSIDDIGHLL